MSSSDVSSLEAPEPVSGLTPSIQVTADIDKLDASEQLSVTVLPPKQPLDGATSESAVQIQTPENVTGGKTPENVTDSPSTVFHAPAASPGFPTPIVPTSSENDTLPDPSGANVFRPPGSIPSPSSFSVVPRTSAPAGVPQQPSSLSITRLATPMSPASLQPPVPGQSSGNRPFFSYNIVPHANVSFVPGQQFQPTPAANHVRGDILHSNTYPLRPPAPWQPLGTGTSNTGAHGLPSSSQAPYSAPKEPPINPQFSFSGNPSFSTDSVQNNSSPNMKSVDTEVGAAGRLAVSSLSTQMSMKTCSNIIMDLSQPPQTNPGAIPSPIGPSFHTFSGVPGISGSSRPTGIPFPGPLSSSVPIQPPFPDSSFASHKHFVPSSAAVPNSASFPAQPQTHQQPYSSLHVAVPPSQPPWLHPSLPGVMQRPSFVQYAGAMPSNSPIPFRNEAPPIGTTCMRAPGFPTVSVEKSSVAMGAYQTSDFSTMQIHSTDIDHEKQTNGLNKKDGTTNSEVANAWTAHKTGAGVIYYYNSLTGESTYEKPSSFQVETDRVTTQPTPVSWEKLPGTDWALVMTNDGKKYYYDTKNKISSWQIPLEVAELKNHKDHDASKTAVDSIQSASSGIDNGPGIASLETPALQTGGRDAAPIRTSTTTVPSSALDLVKKKLQDAGGPTTSSLPSSSLPSMPDSDSPKLNDDTNGQHVDNIKEKVKEANGDRNLSESSSDSEDTEIGPTKDEGMIQFKEMLKERGIAPFSKWEKELPKIIFDLRFKAVPNHATRRSLFEHYVRTRAEEERKEKRAAQKAAIEGFKKLLDDASEDIDKRTDYQKIRRKWGHDPRFEALNRKDRELLLNERVFSLKKAAEEKMQASCAAVVANFKTMLKEIGDITFSTRWSRVKDSLRNDPRYKSVKHEDREALYNEYLSELKAVDDEAELAVKAKKEEEDKLKRREQELRKRKQREEQEMESVRLKVRRKEAETSYQSLLVETIKDPKASWTESKPKLEKDPQGRFTNSNLDPADLEKLFREHVKNLYERSVQDFHALLAEFITAEAAARATDQGKTILTSWSEAKRLLKNDIRYSRISSKDKENLWLRHSEDISRKQKSASRERMDVDVKSKTSADHAGRSPRGRLRR